MEIGRETNHWSIENLFSKAYYLMLMEYCLFISI